MASGGWRGVLGRLVDVAVRRTTRGSERPERGSPRRSAQPVGPAAATTHRSRADPQSPAARPRGRTLVSEYGGPLDLSYEPQPDGLPDPGEIVWAWVPYEEADGRGKDRPVLVIGRDGAALLALMMSSKDHDLDAADEARHGRHWVDVGSGPWDRRGRPSEVRVDRVLRMDPADVRREGATLGRARFDEVAAAVHRVRG